jgi:predicted amidophosphoribosyltransferase
MSTARTVCPNCGFEVRDDGTCSLCGTDLDGE